METVVKFFTLIDAVIQRKLDLLFFFLMNVFGWKKSFIRLLVWDIIILSVVIRVCCRWLENGKQMSFNLVIGFAVVAFMLFSKAVDRANDIAADSKDMLSASDHVFPGMNLLKILFGAMLLHWPIAFIFGGSAFDFPPDVPVALVHVSNASSFVFELSFLLNLYLRCTPKIPPPQKARQKILVEAGQNST